jgi:hypothetical protein
MAGDGRIRRPIPAGKWASGSQTLKIIGNPDSSEKSGSDTLEVWRKSSIRVSYLTRRCVFRD